MATYHLDDTQPHAFWDNSHPPRADGFSPATPWCSRRSGGSANQIAPTSTTKALATLSFDPIHPLTGPVYVEGAEPGDALEVEILSSRAQGLGLERGASPVSDCCPMTFLSRTCITTSWKETRAGSARTSASLTSRSAASWAWRPRSRGGSNTIPPRENGGNLDIRHLTPGTKRFLPRLGAGRALLLRGLPRGSGRWRGERHGHRDAHDGHAALQPGEGGQAAGTALHNAARQEADGGGRGRLLCDHRLWPRPLRERPARRRATSSTTWWPGAA